MKRKWLLRMTIMALLVGFSWSILMAQGTGGTPAEQRRNKSLQLVQAARGAANNPRVSKTTDGYVSFLAAPSDGGYKVTGVNPADAPAVARRFLAEWKDILVNPSPAIGFSVNHTNSDGSLTTVRMDQNYKGLSIFKAQATLQIDGGGRVRHLLSGFVTDTAALDNGQLSMVPKLSKQEARARSVEALADKLDHQTSDTTKTSEPVLVVFSPKVVTGEGPLALCWQVVVESTKPPLAEMVLINAQTGQLAFHYPLLHDAKDRDIYNMAGYFYPDFGVLVREEGDPDTGNNPVDLAYLMGGDIYDFYYSQNGRDSFDNSGATISISVNMFDANAYWDDYYEHIYVGASFLSDDVIAHEFTHGVTAHESQLVYADESGAINESLSDMWGEWFDQTYAFNSYGYDDDDSAASKWLIGEDLNIGPLRNMKDPPALDYIVWGWQMPYPDRYEKPANWYTGGDDAGGVHGNSSVGNKLCYLLTDGDTFNGYTISGLGMSTACDLFYEVQKNIVQADLCYFKMYDALIAGASTLGFSQAQRLNLEKACQAVGIRNDTGDGLLIRNDAATPALVAMFEDSGKLKLKRTMTHVDGAIDTSNGGFIVKNSAGTVVAYIDTKSAGGNDGAMQIKGAVSENVIPGESSSYIWVLRYEGVVVAAIDDSGNLKLWGRHYEGVNDFFDSF